MKHLTIGGSTATRTIACPAWVQRSKGIPKRKAGTAAHRGNLLHDAMEAHYLHNTPFSDMVGELTFQSETLTADDVTEALLPAKDATEKVLNQFHIDEILLEPFVQYTPGEVGGSIDLLGVSEDRKTIIVLDYKFGQSWVPITTKQLPFYGLCAATDPLTSSLFEEAEQIVFAIVQPHRSTEAIIAEHPISVLDEFEEELQDALAHRERSQTGSHCKYCPAASVCPDKKAQANSALVIDPKHAENIAEALELAASLKPWIDEVNRQALEIMDTGGTIPGFKLVASKSLRKWTDESQAAETLENLLGEQAYEKKILTPAKAEKALGKAKKAEIESLIIKPEGKPTLVSESDSRPALVRDEIKNLKDFVAKNSKPN